jgi:hypothetical protein
VHSSNVRFQLKGVERVHHHAKRVNVQQSIDAGAPEREETVNFTLQKMLVGLPPARTPSRGVTHVSGDAAHDCPPRAGMRVLADSLEAGAALHFRPHRKPELGGMHETAPGLVARLRRGVDGRVWNGDCRVRDASRRVPARGKARLAHAASSGAPGKRASRMRGLKPPTGAARNLALLQHVHLRAAPTHTCRERAGSGASRERSPSVSWACGARAGAGACAYVELEVALEERALVVRHAGAAPQLSERSATHWLPVSLPVN